MNLSPSDAQALQSGIIANPVVAAREILGIDLWSKQAEIVRSVFRHRHTAVKSCNSSGKTFVAANIALLFMLAHYPAKVITTAPTGRQVKDLLWQEIRRAWQRSRIRLSKKEPGVTHWELAPNYFATGFSSDNMPSVTGYHSPNLLVIVDESCGVEAEKSDGLDTLMASGNCHRLDIGNPVIRNTPFHRMFTNRTTNCITISAFDTPAFTGEQVPPDVLSTLITREWVEERKDKWGEDSPLYVANVKAQFPDLANDIALPEPWIKIALDREVNPEGPRRQSGDVARFGKDRGVILTLIGNEVMIAHESNQRSTMEFVGHAKVNHERNKLTEDYIDVTGVGGGVVDRLIEQGISALAVDFGGKGGIASDDTECYDARTLMLWELRIAIRDWMKLPNDQRLLSEIEDVRVTLRSDGKIQMEKKDEIKKRLKHSPDYLDALMMIAGGYKVATAQNDDYIEIGVG